MDQGAYYGANSQSSTNYPLVRITDSTGAVIYCNTHGWKGGVQTGTTLWFDIPFKIALGAGTLEVVTNGIPSLPGSVIIK